LGADALYEAGLDERPEKVEGALFGDGQRIPNLARGKTPAVAKQLEQLLLFGAQDELIVLRLWVRGLLAAFFSTKRSPAK
jgi:hypothetical protein